MSKKNEIKELTTTSKKTIEFYSKHPTLNFELMNNFMVDILDELLKGMSGDMTKHMTDKLNNTILEQSKDLLTIKEQLKTIITNNKDSNNDIILKLYDIKKEYINDIKLLIDKHESDNIVKIIDRFDKETQKLVNEVIPKTNNIYYQQYETMMRTFKDEVTQNNFESKYNELLSSIEKSITHYISNTENKIINNISDIKLLSIQNNTTQDKVNTELMTFLDKSKNSSYKGQMAENQIESIINKLFPYAEVKRTADEDGSGDFIMSRNDNIPILFEIKDYNRNIPTEEIQKFIRDVTDNNMCGIFLSISTGISKKRNFEIEISENNNIMLYIHNMHYDPDKIKLGVDIIDNLYNRLKLSNKNDVTISTELLSNINKEYNTFITKRTQAIDHIKESTKKTIQYIEEIELKTLNDYISSKFSFKNNNKLRCDNCKNFVGTNAKSLAAHQRKCKNKQNDEPSDDSPTKEIVV
jgi:hypothetical protein